MAAVRSIGICDSGPSELLTACLTEATNIVMVTTEHILVNHLLSAWRCGHCGPIIGFGSVEGGGGGGVGGGGEGGARGGGEGSRMQ